jgi:peptide/nickel transport system permease protein
VPPPETIGDELEQTELGEGVAFDGELLPEAAIIADEKRRPLQGIGVGAWIAIGWMVLIVLIAVLAKTGIVTWGDPQAIHASCARKGPFANDGTAPGHPLGCDSDGRDMAARLALGAWTSLLVSVGAILVGFIFGGGLGLISGYYADKPRAVIAAIAGAFVGAIFGIIVGGVVFGAAIGLPDAVAATLGALLGAGLGAYLAYRRREIDTLIANVFNVMLSVPAIVLALAFVAFLQGSEAAGTKAPIPDELVLIIAIGVVAVPLIGRITRASALTWSQRDFVLAARAQGAKDGRIMVREVLPNVAPAMFSISLLSIAIAIVAEGTLAILGVGVRAPTPSWGNIIALDRGELFTSPHIVFEASLLIFFTVLALNHLGDVVRSRFDVREAGI